METNQNTETKKPSNPRMHNPDGMYASQARNEDYVSLRDEIAMRAMQGMLSNSAMYDAVTLSGIGYLSEEAYLIADQMLKQREIENL